MGNCPACFHDTTIHHNSNDDEDGREAVESVNISMDTTNGKHFHHPLFPHEHHKACVKTATKKVRFADEVELISSVEEEEPIVHNNVSSDELCIKEGSQLSGTLKVRVVITKKQYTELMSPTSTPRQREQNDALIESMLAPLLSPQSHLNDQACRDQNPNLVHKAVVSLQPLIY